MENNYNWVYKIKDAPKIKKYSQTGEEGILKFILDNVGHEDKFLVDIGAWDGFHLSNTRYFIEEFGYGSLLIDGDNRGNEDVKTEWITKDNVCDIMRKHSCPKEFSLLSYDTDGNDFDILHALCLEYKPKVIVCEINGTIPVWESKKIKYNPEHTWSNDDYYGFSFSAGFKLAELIGYTVVFQNDALNMYMVRNDLFNNTHLDIPIEFIHNPYHPHNHNGEWVEV